MENNCPLGLPDLANFCLSGDCLHWALY
jgi:hypothetical protein